MQPSSSSAVFMMCLDRDLAWLGAASSAPSFNPSAASTSSTTTLHHLPAINLPGHPLLWTHGESPPSKRSCHAQLDHSGKPHAGTHAGRCTASAGGCSPRIVSIPGLQHHAAGARVCVRPARDLQLICRNTQPRRSVWDGTGLLPRASGQAQRGRNGQGCNELYFRSRVIY